MFEINYNIYGLKLFWIEKLLRFKIGCFIFNELINIDMVFKIGLDYIFCINNILGYFFWKDIFIVY